MPAANAIVFRQMILRNGRLILPNEIRDGLEVAVRNGKIEEIRAETAADGDVIDLQGNYLSPGFIDIHVHGALGHDTMEASAEAFRAICEYHRTGGTTALLLTTATAPIEEIVTVLSAVRRCGSSIPEILGVHLEGPFISKNKHGAHAIEFIRDPSTTSVGRLLEYRDVVKRITIAPELAGALNAIDAFASAGISVSGGHSDALEDEAKAAFNHGMRSVTHIFNCMSSSRRNGTFRRSGLIEFALAEAEISCELIADGYHVSPVLMQLVFRAKGPADVCLVTDATAGAGLPNDTKFLLGGAECVVKDRVALLADRSALAGSTARMIDLVRTLVEKAGVPLHDAVVTATESPARALRLRSKGRLQPGYDADFAIISPELEIVRTIKEP